MSILQYTGHWYIATLTGQSEASITGLVDNSTLTEWGLVTGTPSRFNSQGQYVFPGLRFRCNGNVTKWIVGLSFCGALPRYPALGIYRDRPGAAGFADRVGATLLVNSIDIDSQVLTFMSSLLTLHCLSKPTTAWAITCRALVCVLYHSSTQESLEGHLADTMYHQIPLQRAFSHLTLLVTQLKRLTSSL